MKFIVISVTERSLASSNEYFLEEEGEMITVPTGTAYPLMMVGALKSASVYDESGQEIAINTPQYTVYKRGLLQETRQLYNRYFRKQKPLWFSVV